MLAQTLDNATKTYSLPFAVHLLEPAPRRDPETRDKLAEAACTAGLNTPSVALVSLSQAAGVSTEPGRLPGYLYDYIERMFAQTDGYLFGAGTGRIGILFDAAQEATVLTLIREAAAALLLTATVGLGSPQPRPSDAHRACEQAAEALRHAFYRGSGTTIRHSELPVYRSGCDYPHEREQALHAAVRSADSRAAIDREVGRFYDALIEDGPLAPEDVHEMTIRLLVGMEQRLLADSGKDAAPVKCDIIAVIRLETFADVKRHVASFLAEAVEALHSQPSSGHRNVVSQSLTYMEQACKDASLDSIAKKVFVTPTYLSLLFKTSTGRTFIEMLTDIRIAQAKRILETTQLKNYEVADRVGYQDSRYFSQIFRKRVGLSPSEYRESVAKRTLAASSAV